MLRHDVYVSIYLFNEHSFDDLSEVTSRYPTELLPPEIPIALGEQCAYILDPSRCFLLGLPTWHFTLLDMVSHMQRIDMGQVPPAVPDEVDYWMITDSMAR